MGGGNKLKKARIIETWVTRKGKGERREKKKAKAGTDWPSIKPKRDLQFNRLAGNDLITVPSFLTSSESKAFVQVAESLGFVRQGSLGLAYGEAFRDNDRISVNDPLLVDRIWEAGLSKLFTDIKYRGKVVVGLNLNIRFYRLCDTICDNKRFCQGCLPPIGPRIEISGMLFIPPIV